MFYDFRMAITPKWYQLRWKVSRLLVRLAKLIYPESPAVRDVFAKVMMDAAITGGSVVVRVDPIAAFNDVGPVCTIPGCECGGDA